MRKSEHLKVHWRPAATARRWPVPPGMRRVLLDSGSLTDQLERCCPGSFNLQLLNQSWQRPLLDECLSLALPEGRHALVREIVLQCDNTPLVYGRSIIPANMFRGRERRLAYLGRRSLGDYLFSRPGVSRGPIEIAGVPVTFIPDWLPVQGKKDELLWARRSIFRLHNKPLLVVEVFLPGMSQCNQDK